MTFRTAASYTYDAYGRVRTFTDSEGWTVTYDYDAADRVTKVTYPDGTVETLHLQGTPWVKHWTGAQIQRRKILTRSEEFGLIWRVDFELSGQSSDFGLVNRIICWRPPGSDDIGAEFLFGQHIPKFE